MVLAAGDDGSPFCLVLKSDLFVAVTRGVVQAFNYRG
jgi:hypothetical protein